MSTPKKVVYAATGVVAVVAVSAYLLYPRTVLNPGRTGKLSDRAAQYLAQQGQNDEAWKTVRLADEEKTSQKGVSSRMIKVGTCFAVTVPISVVNIKNKGKCFTVFATESPKGNIRTYQQDTEYADVNEVSDLKMRRMYPDRYREREIVKAGAKIYSFEDNDPLMYDAVTFYLHGRTLIIISMQYPTSENLDTIMDKVVQSIEIL